MTIDLDVTRAPQAFGPPAWCADVYIDVKFPPESTMDTDLSLEVEALALEGRYENLLIWPRGGWQAVYPCTISKSSTSLPFRVPVTREIVQAIENRRGGKSPLSFQLQVSLRYRQIRSVRQADPKAGTLAVASKSEVTSSSVQWVVHRDPWNDFLRGLGWRENEIFEIRTGPDSKDQNITAAMGALRSAEDLLRSGNDPAVVLGKCYQAFETAAKYAVQDGDKKREGFEALLAKAFPAEPDKAAEVDRIIRALNSFAQLGRHGEYPVRHISTAEARFALKATLAVIELVGCNGS